MNICWQSIFETELWTRNTQAFEKKRHKNHLLFVAKNLHREDQTGVYMNVLQQQKIG